MLPAEAELVEKHVYLVEKATRVAMRKWTLSPHLRATVESGAQFAIVCSARRALLSPDPAAYLFQAALNGAIDALRSEWGRDGAKRGVLLDDEEWEAFAIVDPSPGPCDRVVDAAAVRELLDGLDDRRREMVLRRAAGERLPEIAARFGVTDARVSAMIADSGNRRCPVEVERTRVADDATLTGRESEVLQLVADGLSNREISERLFMGEETVKTHVKHLLAKLEAQSRAHAVAIAFRRGIIV